MSVTLVDRDVLPDSIVNLERQRIVPWGVVAALGDRGGRVGRDAFGHLDLFDDVFGGGPGLGCLLEIGHLGTLGHLDRYFAGLHSSSSVGLLGWVGAGPRARGFDQNPRRR